MWNPFGGEKPQAAPPRPEPRRTTKKVMPIELPAPEPPEYSDVRRRRDTPSDSQMGGIRMVTLEPRMESETLDRSKESRDYTFANFLVEGMKKHDAAVRTVCGIPSLCQELVNATFSLILNVKMRGTTSTDNDVAEAVFDDLSKAARRIIDDPRNRKLIEASLG